MIYRLVHKTSATHMTDEFNVGASIIRKYVMPYTINKSCLASILVFNLVIVYKKL